MSNMRSSKERKSLCEESMLVFVNILKLSSLSLARRTLVTKSADDDHDQDHNLVDHEDTPPLTPEPQPHRIKRSQKLEQPQESKLSYVMLPEDEVAAASPYIMKNHKRAATFDGQFSDYIRRFHKKTEEDLQNAIVEGKAANYIKRFHEKNMKDINNESMRRMHYVLPPPPHQAFK